MALEITLEAVLGVYVIDLDRLSEDGLDNYLGIYEAVELFLNEQGKPSFMHYCFTTDNHEDNYDFTEGHFMLLSDKYELELVFNEEFSRRADDDGYFDKDVTHGYQYSRPRIKRWEVIKDETVVLKTDQQHYCIPTRQGYMGTPEEVSQVLRRRRDVCRAGGRLENYGDIM
ncbi:MAG TPA: hypothetical protein VHL11_00390 [Phototrophicaceae bacterium]|jgi:hypothetical protein|nr:hypothetical protein [Phototrophicaceae bacterium]